MKEGFVLASYQRVALFLLFDALERDLVSAISAIKLPPEIQLLSSDEITKAAKRIETRIGESDALDSSLLISSLDLGDKLAVLNRHKIHLPANHATYYSGLYGKLTGAISARNALMHGRPLTATEYATGFALANDLVQKPAFWPTLAENLQIFNKNPESFVSRSIEILDDDQVSETLNNLPQPDYDDTGFVSRPQLEKELRKKLLGRHPVVTVLGDGGNGKTALALHVLYGLLDSADHGFDAIVWVSAKTSQLTSTEIKRIEGAISDSIGIFSEVAEMLEPGDGSPIDRVQKLLEDNKILLAIDNLETVLDKNIQDFANDIPGESKLLLTSRVPLGSDLTVNVDGFSEEDALSYCYRLAEAYSIDALKKIPKNKLSLYLGQLDRKPLLIKWFALGIEAGLSPDSIVLNPKIALQYCLENVLERLSPEAKALASTMTLIPNALSIAVIEHITHLSASQAEEAVSELYRFGLVETEESEIVERRYRMKPFSRSYVVQAIPLDPNTTASLLSKYREVEAAYQFERAGPKRDISNPRNFVVRSPAEAIAARKLRNAVFLSFKGRLEEAFAEVDELKITMPSYFEIWRADAFISQRGGDYARATSSYETALALGQDQPQLYYFLAHFQMTVFSDYSSASENYDKAIELGLKTVTVLTEAARNEFFRYEFDRAQRYIFEASTVINQNFKDKAKLLDVNAQLYIRGAEFKEDKGDFDGALADMEHLHFLIKDKPLESFDSVLVEHLMKVPSRIDRLRQNFSSASAQGVIDALRDLLSGLPNAPQRPQTTGETERKYYSGKMKPVGSYAQFGFLRDTWGADAFIAKRAVSDDLWYDLCQGVQVMYEIGTDAQSRTFARNVTRV